MNPAQTNDRTRFLRQSLRANAIFSTLSGLLFLFASGSIAAFLGEHSPVLVASVGGQLLFFAAALTWLASRSNIPTYLVLGVITADLLWVVGTIVVVYAELFSRGGAIAAIVVADIVLLLAVLQSIGVYRSGRTIVA